MKYERMSYVEIYSYIAQQITEKKVIGWYQGRSENGPRALGNRSILADPRDKDMKNYLNEKVKFREWYRPYAPAILKEHVSEWFENIDDCPYMLRICKYKTGMGEKVQSACHIDYTGRLQTVTKESNLHFYNLISEFYKLTNIPILLNTSFNGRGEPIVDSPQDAFDCFKNNKIDILVLKDFVIWK
jgi:carbamoyltransferase